MMMDSLCFGRVCGCSRGVATFTLQPKIGSPYWLSVSMLTQWATTLTYYRATESLHSVQMRPSAESRLQLMASFCG